MDLSRGQEMAAKEKCAQVAGGFAPLDWQKQRHEHDNVRSETQPDAARLAWLLRRQPAHESAGRGRMDTPPITRTTATARKTPSLWADSRRSSTMAQPMVCDARAL